MGGQGSRMPWALVGLRKHRERIEKQLETEFIDRVRARP